MSYELRKPITDTQRANFIVEHNHKNGLKIEDTEMYLFALEADEIMGEKEIEIEVPDFTTIEEEVEVPVLDEEGNPTFDENEEPIVEIETVEKTVPVMVEYEETVEVEDFDEEGNVVGSHEETVTKERQQTHTETLTIPYPVKNPDWGSISLANARELKSAESLQKANFAIENGYVEFKGAQFETNAQTVGDLTATMLMLQASGQESYMWLSRDDKVVELFVEDFVTLGGLIAYYKNAVWNVKYLTYKNAIEAAETAAEVEAIEIDYTIPMEVEAEEEPVVEPEAEEEPEEE